MERSVLNITYKDRRTNIWVRERTKVIDIMYTVRKRKWHINRLKDNRWTSRVTTWRPHDKRPAKQWRDDLDKYWSYTIWQRTTQERVIWRRHGHNGCLMMMTTRKCDCKHISWPSDHWHNQIMWFQFRRVEDRTTYSCSMWDFYGEIAMDTFV